MMRASTVPQAWPAGPALLSPRAARVIARRLVERLRQPDVTIPLAIAFGVRVVVMLAASVLLRFVIGGRHSPFASINLIGAWNRKDAIWYLAIAQSGYDYSPVDYSRANFFPLYPMLVAFVGRVAQAVGLPEPYTLAGMAISWVTFAAACVALYQIALLKFDRRVATGAILLLSVFPFSFYYGAPYTESIYLVCVAIAFLAVERRNWWLAAAVAGIASASRPPGLMLGACVGLAYLIDYARARRWLRWDMLSLALIPTGALAYMAYCWARWGDPLAYVKTSKAGWHSGLQLTAPRLAWQLVTTADTWHIVIHPHVWILPSYLLITLHLEYSALTLLCLATTPFVWRKMGPVYAVFLLLSVAAPLLNFPTLNSLGRYLSVLFPAFFILAWALRDHPRYLYVLAGLSLIALCGYASYFIAGFGLS
ncbi:MAG TPA: hypothetical protein VF808_10760 [Ktedonobacterales bacterium]